MSAPSPVPRPRAETYERLSEVYLDLWRQIRSADGDNNWLEVLPNRPAPIELTSEELDRLERPAKGLRADYEKVRQLARGASVLSVAERTAFCDRLRDKGLECAARADALLPEDLGATL